MAENPLTPAEEGRRELTALAATITTLSGLTDNRARGTFLMELFKQKEFLIKYFRAAYDIRYQYGVRSATAWLYRPNGRQPHARLTTLLRELGTGVLAGEAAGIAWVNYTATIPEELWEVAAGVLDKDLQCGVTPALLNKVFERMGLAPMQLAQPRPPQDFPGLCIHISSVGTIPVGHASAYLSLDGERVANLALTLTATGLRAIRALRAAGITFDIPAHVKAEF